MSRRRAYPHTHPLRTQASLPIAALAYARFHAECGLPMHLLPRPSRPSFNARASHCPSINSLPRPSRSSHTRPSRSLHKLALMPIASRPIHTPRFHAHRSPPTQSLPRHLRHYHTLAASLAFTLIAVLPYTRFQTLPLNTLEFTRIAALPYTSFFLPSRSSHTLASKPTALEYPRFHAHCCPPVNSFHFPSRPGGPADTRFFTFSYMHTFSSCTSPPECLRTPKAA